MVYLFLLRFRGRENGFVQPHGISTDSKGNIFVAELSSPEFGGGKRVIKLTKI